MWCESIDNQPMILCHCPHCGLLFKARSVEIAGYGINVTFSNSTTDCIRCRRKANILDGTYGTPKGVLELIAAPRTTREKYEEFYALLKTARAERMPLDEAADRAEAINPEFGAALRLAQRIGGKREFWIGLLILFLMHALSVDISLNANVDLDVNYLIEQIIGETIAPSSRDNGHDAQQEHNSRDSDPASDATTVEHRPAKYGLLSSHKDALLSSASPVSIRRS